MPFVKWLEEVRFGDRDSAGDKAARLGELIRAGFAVPPGYCIGAGAYRDAFAANGLNQKISAHLNSIEVSDPAQLEQAAEAIRQWIEQASLSAEIETEIRDALAALDAPTVAVRASRVSEDVPSPSASGLPQTYLAVPAGQVLNHIRKTWTSPWNSRAIYFRHRKKIPPEQVCVAVVVQTMIDSDAAGVMFTASPLGKNPSEIHIDAIWGLGEAVVAARWRPDHYVVDKASGRLREKYIASKTVMNVVGAEGGVQTIGVADDKSESACLADAQISKLAVTGKEVEVLFKELADIEWCIKDDEILLLQARPMLKK